MALLVASPVLGSPPPSAPHAVGPFADPEKGFGQENVYTPAVTPRGIRPNQPYQFGEIDSIDLASGNVTLRVPLGQVFEVGPMLSYQLQAVNNSNVWDYVQIPCVGGADPNCDSERPSTFAMPNAGSNAGLGWEVQPFGRLYPFFPPTLLDQTNKDRWPNFHVDPTDDGFLSASLARWLYVAPDGSRHTLHWLPDRDNGTSALPIRYSKDNTMLRMQQIDASTARLEFPDGTYSIFEKTGATATGTNFCGVLGGTAVSGCWRFKEKLDPYGNRAWITYGATATEETWTVHDSTGRSSTITFSITDADTGGGDGTGFLQTQDGDEWGDLRRVVTEVEVPTFGANTASYGFTYANHTIGRSCPPNTSGTIVADETITTRVLTDISVPDALPYSFVTNTNMGTTCSDDDRGKVTQVTLPTRGQIDYVYGSSWSFPTLCNFSNQANQTAPFAYTDRGIVQKVRRTPDGTADGMWNYATELKPSTGLVSAGADCTRADYRITTVDGPTNTDGNYTRTVNYYAVHQGPRDPQGNESGTDWQITDQGLPYSKHSFIGGTDLDRLFLSSETYLCGNASCDGTASELLRSVYRRYVSEFRGVCNRFNGEGDSPGCYQINAMQRAERTVFEDDADQYVQTTGTVYDGAGHFRLQTTTDDFGSSLTTRSVNIRYSATDVGGSPTTRSINGTTGYVNVGTPSTYLPDPADPWILTTYDQITKVGDGRTYVTDVVFNDSGSVVCTRARKNSGALGGQDRVVKLTLGTTEGTDAGLPVTEEVSGGEAASVPAGSVCDTLDTTASDGRYYEFKHEFTDLQLSRSYIEGFPNRYRADIDQNTGLPEAIYNEADEAETLEYDDLGRLTKITPDASRNEAVTEYVYDHPVDADPRVTMTRLNGLAELTSETTVYDHFGRVIREMRKNPDGDSGDYLSDQRTVYDDAGNVESKTTRQEDDTLNTALAWIYSDYDPFGRPGAIEAPDGQITTLGYVGVREESRTVGVYTGMGGTGTEDLTTTTTRDARGRTMKVETTEHVTDYSYDPNDKMVSAVRHVPSPGSNQVRTYGFDARGYLLSASLPEVTGNGGAITYKPDAIGLSWQMKDGQHDLAWTYDANGRPLRIANTAGGLLWKTWAYGVDNDGANQQKGRLVQAVRYNRPPVGEDVAIIESYQHENGTAGPSQTKRQVWWTDRAGNAQWGPTFRSTMDYDKLGNVTSMGYPACIANTMDQGSGIPCNDGNDLVAPAATGTWTYNEGLMRSASLSLGPSAVFNYHHNLQLGTVGFGNNLDGVHIRGTNGMVRPARMGVQDDQGAVHWDSGAYGYDAAGNIKSIGDDDYTYDGANRLRSATVKQADANRSESYSYNTTDSMTQVVNDQFGIRNYSVSTDTNRLLGVGTGVNDWTYTGSGNTLSALGGAITFSWDALNMLTRYQEGSKDFVSVYGPGDYRVWVEDRSTGTKYWTSRGGSGKILREYEVTASGGAWKHTRDFLYGAEGIVASVDHDGTEFYYHSDHLGTPRLKTTASGTVFSEHHYYPYGLEADDFGLIFEDGFESGDVVGWEKDKDVLSVKYTGHERERYKNLDYMLGRHYIFLVNRFASVDPAWDGWNQYAYVRNNPVRFIDPTGENLTIVISFDTAELSEQQQTMVMVGIREAFVNAGVQNVQVMLGGGSVGPPNRTKDHDVVRLKITDESLDFEGRSVLGKTKIGSDTSTVSTNHAPSESEAAVAFLVNVGAHEAAHATRGVTQYDGDAFEKGTLLNPYDVQPEPGTIMEQGVTGEVLGASRREFSKGDAEQLRTHLNDQN